MSRSCGYQKARNPEFLNDLTRITEAWPKLREAIRAEILMIVQVVGKRS